jgi:hypothetical protein
VQACLCGLTTAPRSATGTQLGSRRSGSHRVQQLPEKRQEAMIDHILEGVPHPEWGDKVGNVSRIPEQAFQHFEIASLEGFMNGNGIRIPHDLTAISINIAISVFLTTT